MDSIVVTKIKGTSNKWVVRYKSWYDNEAGFSPRTWDGILALADQIDRFHPKASTEQELIQNINKFNQEWGSDIVSFSRKDDGLLQAKVEERNRQAFSVSAGLRSYLVEEAQFNRIRQSVKRPCKSCGWQGIA